MKYLKIILPLVILLAFQSCYYDKEELLYPETSSTCDTTNVTFSKSVAPLLSQQCLSCHSNSTALSYGANIKLENYTDVKNYATNGQLLGAVIHKTGYSPMPKGASKMTTCKTSTIRIWVNAGSPNN